MYFKRVIYFFYYLKKLDTTKFNQFLKYVHEKENIAKRALLMDIIYCSLKYNISFLEYFQFHFYKLSRKERSEFAGTGYMYEYQLVMNPKSSRELLENKFTFLNEYSEYIHHRFASLKEIKADYSIGQNLLYNKSGKLVLKHSKGQCGNGIEVIDCNGFNVNDLIQRLEATGNDLVEEFVIQHKDLRQLSSSGLNTIRIITQLDNNDQVEILGARLRISINSSVDNLAAGNIAAPINLASGVVEGPGVYSDITKPAETIHPISNIQIEGFQIPFWKESVDMISKAALKYKQNRSIGWDIAITDHGPELIEGNHDWCKLLWQLPVHRGLKYKLEKHIK